MEEEEGTEIDRLMSHDDVIHNNGKTHNSEQGMMTYDDVIHNNRKMNEMKTYDDGTMTKHSYLLLLMRNCGW